MSQKFAARLIALRKERGLSQEDIGKIINKKRSTISGYETEGKEPDIDTICVLADYFDVSTDYLLGNADRRRNVDTVFFNDTQNIRKHYEAAPEQTQIQAANLFDSFYRLIVRDVQCARPERLEVYNELFKSLSAYRAQIIRTVDLAHGSLDPAALSAIMSLQSDMKNDVSTILDKLMQADFSISFDAAKSDSGEVE